MVGSMLSGAWAEEVDFGGLGEFVDDFGDGVSAAADPAFESVTM